MARIARVVAERIPHHVTQRGNRRMTTFFTDDDYRAYLALLKTWTAKRGVAIWAYCLMPNHVHLIAVPHGGLTDEDLERLRRHARTGWPLGAQKFVVRLENRLGRLLAPQKTGRKSNTAGGQLAK